MDETLYKRSPQGQNKQQQKGRLFIGNRSVNFTKDIYIGRGEDNQIVLDKDDQISRQHALIRVLAGRAYIKDLNSTNGTYVNGQPLPKGKLVPLNLESVIRIGNTSIRYA